MSRYIIGVHSGHDASACLMKDNRILYAVEKERLTRRKHDSGDPIECIEYIIDAAGLKPSEIDLVVRCNWFDSSELDDAYYGKFPKVIVRYQHHLFHAYAVSLMCQERNMLAYIVDGRGCRPEDNGEPAANGRFESESIYYFCKNSIHPVKCMKHYARHLSGKYRWGSHMDSIGYAYADVSRVIFQDYHAAGKVMALAAYGRKNEQIPKALLYGSGALKISQDWLDFLNRMEIPLDYTSRAAKDLAFSIQDEVEVYMNWRIQDFIDKYNCADIGLSGGVALNCKNNGLLANQPYVNSLHVFPAAGDDGLSIGAAVWAARELYGDYRKISWKYGLGRTYQKTIFDDVEILKVAKLLHDQKIVGIYKNGSEFGPRALCNRSIIASAAYSDMRYRLNAEIKKRELFRPFGGVVLERNVEKVTDEKVASDYMLSAVHIKGNFREK